MEATAAIAVIEIDLRRLVDAVLIRTQGADWRSSHLGIEIRTKLEKRMEEERKRRSPAEVSSDLLAYTHLYELRQLIEQQWQDFAKALGEKREFSVLIDKVEDFRNAPAHSRELLPYEKALLEGISGDIRTKVTRYLSEQSTDSMHYPNIESIRDSFGNEPSNLGDGEAVIVSTHLSLQVGQTVQFEGRAWDPQGRELTWRWGPTFTRLSKPISGNDVTFSWVLTPEDVARDTFLAIELTSSGPYHRYTSYDHRVTFSYRIDPPSS